MSNLEIAIKSIELAIESKEGSVLMIAQSIYDFLIEKS